LFPSPKLDYKNEEKMNDCWIQELKLFSFFKRKVENGTKLISHRLALWSISFVTIRSPITFLIERELLRAPGWISYFLFNILSSNTIDIVMTRKKKIKVKSIHSLF